MGGDAHVPMGPSPTPIAKADRQVRQGSASLVTQSIPFFCEVSQCCVLNRGKDILPVQELVSLTIIQYILDIIIDKRYQDEVGPPASFQPVPTLTIPL